jgi:hypothetical protein
MSKQEMKKSTKVMTWVLTTAVVVVILLGVAAGMGSAPHDVQGTSSNVSTTAASPF